MPESVKTRSSSGPTTGAIVRWVSSAAMATGYVAAAHRDQARAPSRRRALVWFAQLFKLHLCVPFCTFARTGEVSEWFRIVDSTRAWRRAMQEGKGIGKMSQLSSRSAPELLPPFWPVEDQHGVGHVQLEGEPPANPAEVMPLLLKLAAQSDAMRSLQSAEGETLSESAASVLRGEMAETMRELADLIDDESAETVRLRAKGLSGGIEHREMTLEIARSGPPPALEIVCGPLCTWRMKTRVGLHSFLAAARDEEQQGLLDQLDDSLEAALAEVEAE